MNVCLRAESNAFPRHLRDACKEFPFLSAPRTKNFLSGYMPQASVVLSHQVLKPSR